TRARAISESGQDTLWKGRSFVLSLLDSLRSRVRRVRSNMTRLRSAGHGSATCIDAARSFHVALRQLQQFARGFGIAANEHGVMFFLIRVLLERNTGRIRIEKEGVFAFEAQ